MIGKRNGTTVIALLLFLIVNALFILKYSMRMLPVYASLILCIGYVTFILMSLWAVSKTRQLRKISPVVAITLMVIVTGLLVAGQRMIDPYALQVDRWSAIHNFLYNLFHGAYPYAAQTHLGGYGSPFPVWQVFHIPFYLLGNVGLSFVLGLFMFVNSLWLLGGHRKALGAFALLVVSPAFVYEVMVRSDMMTNFLVCAALLMYFHRYRIHIRKHYLWIGIVVGLMASTRFSAVIPLAIYFFADSIYMGFRKQMLCLLVALVTFTLTFLPFVFWDRDMLFFFEYNPFVLQTRQGNVADLLVLIPIGIWAAFAWKRKFGRFAFLTAVCLLLLVVITFVHNMWQDNSWSQLFESQYDITYFNMSLPFLIIAFVLSKKTGSIYVTQRRIQPLMVVVVVLLLMAPLSSYAEDYEETGLPVCYISTENNQPVVSKYNYMNATMTLVDNGDTLFCDEPLQIRGRGNATWFSYAKKPYKLKFSRKINMLSGQGKHYALLANYCDKSLMRVAVGLKVCRLLNMEWTPDDDYVELVLNGEYLGNYQLAETVRKDKDRVNISSSGFLLQYDPFWYTSDSVYFFTDTDKYAMVVKYPDEDVVDKNVEGIKAYVDDFENALENGDYLWDKIDLESFAKFYYATNVLMLLDTNHYFLKNDDTGYSTMHMGPMWDFEWSLGIGWYYGRERPNPNHALVDSCYFKKLSNNDVFMKKVIELHHDYGQLINDSILSYYDELSDKLEKSQKLNFDKWKILDKRVSVGAYPLGSWEAEVACDKAFFTQHIQYLDKTFSEIESIRSIEIPADSHSDAIFTLSGQRLGEKEPQKGIYIKKGKKWIR